MTDKELLTLAAKAAGIELMKNFMVPNTVARKKDGWLWAPLTDDGDALRLAVKLRLNMEFFHDELWVFYDEVDLFVEVYDDDPYAATRRAIVRAAAEIGRGME